MSTFTKESQSIPELRHIIINGDNSQFKSNLIKTAKYNLISFLPLALLYQYTNYFNIYFLIVTIILSIKSISTMSWTIGVIPYLVVIGMSLIREGVEDYKKNSYDKKFNNLQSKKFNYKKKEFETIAWKDLKVGDVIQICKNEQIPCDGIIIKSSNENNLCYLETTNLDGESALKARESIDIFQNIKTTSYHIYVDHPNKNIYKVDGYIISDTNQKNKIFFNINNILLRGGTLKNADFVYCVVIYTGPDSKIMQNINKQNYKQSHIEKLVNSIVIFVILLTFLICIVGAIAGSYKQIWLKDHLAHFMFSDKEYLENKNVRDGFKYFGTYFLIFNNIIPICLMIALEVVKGAQVFFASFDQNLYSDKGDKLKFLSFRIHEDLGNVKYIFCDKTGTLTKNEMRFKACSIYGKIFSANQGNGPKKKNVDDNVYFDERFDKTAITNALNNPNSNIDIIPNDVINKYNEAVKFFLMNISINHSVLTEKNNSKIDYQSTNPDETTLVNVAAEFGYKFISRVGNIVTIEENNSSKQYTILNRFEFSSARLRSSIILLEPETKKYYIMMKGADSVVLSPTTLNSYSLSYLVPSTKAHIEAFARNGLRTLCYCMREIKEDEYEAFNSHYSLLKTKSITDKTCEDKVEELIKGIESGMTLLGATALEDKLQDFVRKDINDYINAGIHVWMLTGDKLDTAESIAYSCKLFNDETHVFRIRTDEEDIEGCLKKISKQMKKIEQGKKEDEILRDEKVSRIREGMEFIKKKNNTNHNNKDENGINVLTEEMKRLNNNCPSKEDNKDAVLILNQQLNQNDKKQSYPKGKIKLKPNQTEFPAKSLINSHLCESNKDLLRNQTTTAIEKETNKIPKEKIDDKEIMNFMLTENYFGNNPNKLSPTTSAKDIKEKNNLNESEKSNSLSSVVKDIIDEPHPVDELRNTLQRKITNIEHNRQRSSGINLKFKISNKSLIKTFPNSSEIDTKKNLGLILEGSAITKCITNTTIRPLFLSIISNCRSVVCSRCAPIQKSEMVSFVKKNACDDYSSTVAVGDGGNDVNMLKTADIGIGIFGKEGYQAAFNSDYAVSKFKYIKRLIFYHGRYFLMRNSYFIYHFFYKSVIYAMPNFWFLFYNGYSSTIIYDDAQFLIYNALGSNFLVGVRAVLEEDIDMNFEDYPNRNEVKKLTSDIYRDYRDRIPFCAERFTISFIGGLFHSAMIFYIPNCAIQYMITDDSGIAPDHWTYALICYINIIVYQTLVSYTDSYYFHWFTVTCYFIHIICNFLTLLIRNFAGDDQCAGITIELCKTWTFWMIIFLTTIIGYFPYLIISRFDSFFIYDIVNSLRYGKYQYDIEKKKYLTKLEHVNKLKRIIDTFRKYYEEDKNNTVNQSKDKKIGSNYMDTKLSELVEKYRKLKHEMNIKYNITTNENKNTVEQGEDDNHTSSNNQNIQPIFNDYPDFLVDNNKESIEEEDEDEYVFNIEG